VLYLSLAMAFFRGWSSRATDLLLLILMDVSRGLGWSSSYLHGMMFGFGLLFHLNVVHHGLR
jgi:hypothetical protein